MTIRFDGPVSIPHFIKFRVLRRLFLYFGLVSFFWTPVFAASIPAQIILAAENGSLLAMQGQQVIACSFSKMGVTLLVEKVPWKRAQTETQTGRYNGFFMASENKERNSYATFSKPFMFVDWVYIVRKNSDITKKNLNFEKNIFAANAGSSRFNWLELKHQKKEIFYKIFSADTSEQLLKMLLLKRMDVVLENRSNLERIIKKGNLDIAKFKIFDALTKPLAVYFSHSFLDEHPSFLKTFNDTLLTCATK